MMEIIVNGETRQLPEGATLAALLQDMSLTGQRLAVEINEVIVPRSAYGVQVLQAGDRVEVVRAIGGGCPSAVFSV